MILIQVLRGKALKAKLVVSGVIYKSDGKTPAPETVLLLLSNQ